MSILLFNTVFFTKYTTNEARLLHYSLQNQNDISNHIFFEPLFHSFSSLSETLSLPDPPVLGVLPPLQRGRERGRRGQVLAHRLVAVLVGHEAQVDLDALGADVGPAAARRVAAGGVGRALLVPRGAVVVGVAGSIEK